MAELPECGCPECGERGDRVRELEGLLAGERARAEQLEKVRIHVLADEQREKARLFNEVADLERLLAVEVERREKAERERDHACYVGDNHHNAAACPHCGDLLGEARRELAEARDKLIESEEASDLTYASLRAVEKERDEARARADELEKALAVAHQEHLDDAQKLGQAAIENLARAEAAEQDVDRLRRALKVEADGRAAAESRCREVEDDLERTVQEAAEQIARLVKEEAEPGRPEPFALRRLEPRSRPWRSAAVVVAMTIVVYWLLRGALYLPWP